MRVGLAAADDKNAPHRGCGALKFAGWGGRVEAAPPFAYIWVMSRSLVSGRKISPTTKLIAAITIGYQRPE